MTFPTAAEACGKPVIGVSRPKGVVHRHEAPCALPAHHEGACAAAVYDPPASPPAADKVREVREAVAFLRGEYVVLTADEAERVREVLRALDDEVCGCGEPGSPSKCIATDIGAALALLAGGTGEDA